MGAGLFLFALWFWYRVETWDRLTLRPSTRDRRFTTSRSALIGGTIFLVLALGYPALGLISNFLEEYRRDQLVLQARIAASALEQLPGPEIPPDRGEIDSPIYRQWKGILSLIARTGDYGFAYLLVWLDDRAVFLADSEEVGSDDESVIGDVWDGIPMSLANVLRGRDGNIIPEVVGPYRDEWGVWITALVPVPGWEIQGKPVWLGVDREAYEWQTANLRLRQAGIIALTLLLGILVFSFALHRVNVEARWQVAESHQRLSLSLQGGNLIAWEFNPEQDRLQLQGEVERLGLTDVVPIMDFEGFLKLLPDDSAAQIMREWQRLAEGAISDIEMEFPLHPTAGRERWAALIGKVLVQKRDGSPLLIAGTLQDISERKEWENQLREEKEAADAANRAKSAFLATMSHEIRTPLNAIIGMSSLLCRADLPPKSRDFVHTILDSGESLLELINDILDYSKIEAGKIEIEQISFSLVALLKEVENVFRSAASEKGLEFFVSKAEEIPAFVIGDSGRVRQVLMNLLSNAMKFTVEGRVELFVSKEGKNELRFTVRDTGIGISEQELGRLFQPFQQADSSITRRFGGSGLGLVISKRLAELMGGVISVESEPGKGSEFRVQLPLPEDRSARTSSGPTAEESEVSNDPGPSLAPLRVLIAEDNPTNQKVIKAMFSGLRQKVTLVENGALAVEKAAAESYDLILMDIQMPVMDGLQAARLIREAEAGRGTHALMIALTANAFKEDREACMHAGMDDYFAKPIKLDQLRQLLHRARGARSHGGEI
jgi:signal transduction histidine kinase/CheY-like chemotaxis protein